MRVRVLAAWILVTLCAIAPIATEAGETWEARLRSEQVTVDDADVTTTNTKDLREHILHHTLDQDPRVMSGEWVDDSLADAKRMLDVDDDADGATPSTNPKPTPASKCAPPNPKQLVKHGWRYNAWRYFPAPIDAATDPVYYSVGVGRDITFDAAIIAKHPRLEVHAFDNTPVASEFIKALGLKGGISPRWHWHELLLAGKDVRELEVALPRDRGDSFTPASADGVYFDGSKRKAGLDRVDGINEKADGAAKKLPARALWRVTETLGHAYVDVLKVDVEGAEFQVIDVVGGVLRGRRAAGVPAVVRVARAVLPGVERNGRQLGDGRSRGRRFESHRAQEVWEAAAAGGERGVGTDGVSDGPVRQGGVRVLEL